MAAKRIILLLDGTWNDADAGPNDTNIVRLRDMISRTLGAPQAPPGAGDAKLVSGYDSGGRENIVYYQRGVGTGFLNRISGGVFGEGLDINVRRGYKFLSYFYHPDDQVFVFGFSRGAFTARSLVGYIAAAGLLKRENCTEEIEPAAWRFYRTHPEDRLPGNWVKLGNFTHDPASFHIDCVGVFDTVGALGVPIGWFWRRNRQRYAFHDVDLSSITRTNFHAIAIDEHRLPFTATVWRKPKFKRYETATEQVWFPGAHADIGGSYIPEEERLSKYPHSLDDITLDWMLKRVRHHYPDFPVDDQNAPRVESQWASGRQHEPRVHYYKVYRNALRSINNSQITEYGWRQTPVGRDRHADPIAEMIHISAVQRLGQQVEVDRGSHLYAPQNLLAALPGLLAAYGIMTPAPGLRQILVVGWNGMPCDETEARPALTNALSRLRAAGFCKEWPITELEPLRAGNA